MVELSPRHLWQFGRLDLRFYRSLVPRGLVRLFGALVLGALLASHISWIAEPARAASIVLVTIVATLLLRFHLRQAPPTKISPSGAERIIWYAAVLAVFGVQLANRSLVEGDASRAAFLMMAPVVAASMLVSALIEPARALVALTLVTVLLAVARPMDFELLGATWLCGAIGAHAVNPLEKRSDLFRAVSIQVVTQAAVAGMMVGVDGGGLSLALGSAGWASVAAVIATSIFWFGVVVLERAFGIVSDWTLLELCSPDQPLIRELCLRAPGTYAHSVMVANLAESAALRIGANPVLVRAMAYYHDIGKLVRPSFFIENQTTGNIHDELSPTLSAQVVVAHVADGVELAKKHRLPKPIVEAIAQHHGTALIRYFYHRALSEARPEEETTDVEAHFRYPGPRPQLREIAVLHLADMVEAAGRAMPKGVAMAPVVRELFARTQADGQLDECELTFRDLSQIEASFVHSYGALRHERVAYPKEGTNGDTVETPDLDPERLITSLQA